MGEPQAQGERQGGGQGDGGQRAWHLGRAGAQLARAAGESAEPWPAEQDGHGHRADQQRARVRTGQLPWQRQEVGDRGALWRTAQHDVQLRDGDGEPDPGQHAVHDRGRDGERRPCHPPYTEQELEQAGGEGDGAGGLPAVLGDQSGGDDGQRRRWAADHERGAAGQSDHDAAHGRGRQACGERGAGGQRDAEGERHGDQEHHERGGEVLRPADPGAGARWCVVGGVGGDGGSGDVEGHCLPVCPGERTQSGPAVSPGWGSGRIGCRGSRRCGGMAWRGGGVRVSPAGADHQARQEPGRVRDVSPRAVGTDHHDSVDQESVNRG